MHKSSEATTLSELDRGLPALAAYLPGVASREPLASAAGPVTRDAVTLFADLSGFTSLSERLALHGTAGTEELGKLIRRTIGGALDAVADHGGDALAFGGDAITAAFESAYAWEEARGAAADIVALVTDARGTPTLAGPVELSVRIGVGGGSVTSEVFAASTRYVLAHVGPGLDAAVQAQQTAPPNGVTVEDVRLELGLPLSVVALPAWAERTLHPVTAQRVAAGGGPPDEHRHVTSVFVSVPPDVTELGGFVATAADMIDELGGDVLQCAGGDKGVVLFAVFGAPVAHADDAARAVHAIERLRGLTGVDFAAGIASGLAFPAAFGGRSRIFLGALGRTTNLAARLMSAAGKGVTLVDERTGAALRGRATLRDTEPKSLKGIAAPVRVAAVESLLAGGREFDSAATPIVGRAEELAAAEELLDRLGGILRVGGAPGSGKSRLAGEITRRARIRGLRVYEGAFDAFGLGRPLAPIADLLRLVLGSPRRGRARDRSDPPRPGCAGTTSRPAVGSAARGHSAHRRAQADDARAELRERVVDVLCADDVPTLAVLEDIHWADELSLRTLATLESRLAGTRLALVTTSRPGLVDTVLPLPELPESDIAAIVRDTWSRLGGGRAARHLRQDAGRSRGRQSALRGDRDRARASRYATRPAASRGAAAGSAAAGTDHAARRARRLSAGDGAPGGRTRTAGNRSRAGGRVRRRPGDGRAAPRTPRRRREPSNAWRTTHDQRTSRHGRRRRRRKRHQHGGDHRDHHHRRPPRRRLVLRPRAGLLAQWLDDEQHLQHHDQPARRAPEPRVPASSSCRATDGAPDRRGSRWASRRRVHPSPP